MANAEFDDMDKQVRFACLLQHFVLKRTSLPVYVAKVERNIRTGGFLIKVWRKQELNPGHQITLLTARPPPWPPKSPLLMILMASFYGRPQGRCGVLLAWDPTYKPVH